MVKSARKLLQSAVIDTIRKRENKTFQDIAESIGVHRSHIHKVSKGIRQLSEAKFNELCAKWEINLVDLVHKLELDNERYLQRKTLILLLKAREVSLVELSQKTGISLLDLNQIQRERRHPTKDEVDKLAKVLKVDENMIEEGQIAIVFELIQKSLKFLHIDPSAIDAVLKFLEREL